jgi:hypothetical protein
MCSLAYVDGSHCAGSLPPPAPPCNAKVRMCPLHWHRFYCWSSWPTRLLRLTPYNYRAPTISYVYSLAVRSPLCFIVHNSEVSEEPLSTLEINCDEHKMETWLVLSYTSKLILCGCHPPRLAVLPFCFQSSFLSIFDSCVVPCWYLQHLD